MTGKVQPINFEGCSIGFRNFAGEPGPYNDKGDRSFVIFLEDHEAAHNLEAEGWGVKWPKEVDGINPDEDTRNPYLPVKVQFGQYPPKIVCITIGADGEQHHEFMDEETIGELDWMQFDNVDVVVRPYSWTVQGKSGIKAYCNQLYVTLAQVGFESKYGF